MYGQGMYGAAPLYGMAYGYPGAGQAAQAGRGVEPAPVKFTEGKLFIGGVEANLISKDDLVLYCSKWGRVADAVVMDRKGYGFVTFADPKDAMRFLEQREHELKGRRLDAKAAVPKAHLGTAKLTKKMFVGGTGDLTDADFKEHFSQFGEIEDAAVVRREGQSRGFGFVTFADEISVEKCLLVNHYIKGRKVELKRAVPKDELGAAAGPAAYGAFSPQQVLPQQQFYPYPYAPTGPAPYSMRPGLPPPAAAAAAAAMQMGHLPTDPYAAWYGMGYMPYYPPPAGMYPYGMVQPGLPYGAAGMPYVSPAGHPAAATAAATAARPAGVGGSSTASAPPPLAVGREQFAGPGSGSAAEQPRMAAGGASSSGGSSRGRAEPLSSAGPSLQQQQQQQQQYKSSEKKFAAASLAGPSGSASDKAAVSDQHPQLPQQPAATSTSSGAGAGASSAAAATVGAESPSAAELGAATGMAGARGAAGVSALLMGPSAASTAVPVAPTAAAAAAGAGRRPVVMSYPSVVRPPPVAMGPRGVMLPAGLVQQHGLPPGFVQQPSRSPAGLSGSQQQQQQQSQQQPGSQPPQH